MLTNYKQHDIIFEVNNQAEDSRYQSLLRKLGSFFETSFFWNGDGDVRRQTPAEERELIMKLECFPVFCMGKFYYFNRTPFGMKIYKEVKKWQRSN